MSALLIDSKIRGKVVSNMRRAQDCSGPDGADCDCIVKHFLPFVRLYFAILLNCPLPELTINLTLFVVYLLLRPINLLFCGVYFCVKIRFCRQVSTFRALT